MEWLEIIKVQGGAAGYQGADDELVHQIKKGAACPGLKSIRVFVHATMPEDLMVALMWDGAPPQSFGSPLAQNLEQELKQYGLVDHSVWFEKLPEPNREK